MTESLTLCSVCRQMGLPRLFSDLDCEKVMSDQSKYIKSLFFVFVLLYFMHLPFVGQYIFIILTIVLFSKNKKERLSAYADKSVHLKVKLPSPAHPVTFPMCFTVFKKCMWFLSFGVFGEITVTSCFTCFDFGGRVKCGFATISIRLDGTQIIMRFVFEQLEYFCL